jgi:hypothetical protein
MTTEAVQLQALRPQRPERHQARGIVHQRLALQHTNGNGNGITRPIRRETPTSINRIRTE